MSEYLCSERAANTMPWTKASMDNKQPSFTNIESNRFRRIYHVEKNIVLEICVFCLARWWIRRQFIRGSCLKKVWKNFVLIPSLNKDIMFLTSMPRLVGTIWEAFPGNLHPKKSSNERMDFFIINQFVSHCNAFKTQKNSYVLCSVRWFLTALSFFSGEFEESTWSRKLQTST